jgi:hypothetical protein
MHHNTALSSAFVLCILASACAANTAPEPSTFSDGTSNSGADQGAGGSIAGNGSDPAAKQAAACSEAATVQGGAVAMNAQSTMPFSCGIHGATVAAVEHDVTGASWIVGRAAPVIDFGHGAMHLDGMSEFVARYDASCQETFHVFYTGTTIQGLTVTASGRPYIALTDQRTATLVSMDFDGSERWRKSYDLNLRSVSANAAGDVVLSGTYTSAPDFGLGAMPAPSKGWTDFVLVLDASGAPKWVKTQADGKNGAGSEACHGGSCPSGIAAIADDGTVLVDNGLFATDVAPGAAEVAVLPAGRALAGVPGGAFTGGISRIAYDGSGSAFLFGALDGFQGGANSAPVSGDAVMKVSLFGGPSPLACVMH